MQYVIRQKTLQKALTKTSDRFILRVDMLQVLLTHNGIRTIEI